MFNKLDKEVYDIAEAAKKVMQKEVEEPRSKGEKDFKDMHTKKKVVIDDPEQDPKNAKGVVYKMSEGKMKDLHVLVGKGIKDPKKISKELGLPNTKEVHKAIASLVAGIKESKLDPVNKKAVKKKFDNRKDKDIDNDGDVDSSDEYLHKRRKAISKATSENNKKKVAEAVEALIEKVKSKKPNEVSTIEIDTSNPRLLKGYLITSKKVKLISHKQRSNTDTFIIKGKNKDLIDFLTSKQYDMAADDIKDIYGKELKAESTHLDEKNDALYLIYKDKIKAQQVRNFIKKQYRNKTEVEYAPMDAKNFGVSVFSDRGQADKIKKVVDKKFGKPDDFMLESV